MYSSLSASHHNHKRLGYCTCTVVKRYIVCSANCAKETRIIYSKQDDVRTTTMIFYKSKHGLKVESQSIVP